jgi:hypothetical protein
VHKARAALDEVGANRLSVRQELQADCFAGIWAYHADRTRQILEQGDIEEGLNAASAIGDDRIQQQSAGYVRPDAFTHGSSAQRVGWFRIGLTEGAIDACDTFTPAGIDPPVHARVPPAAIGPVEPAAPIADPVVDAFDHHRSNIQVSGTGVVERLLPDDDEGSRHQRFVLRLDPGHTVLVAHNIDLAARVPALAAGNAVDFAGEYVWNEKGGVLHWTHRDPAGRHAGGWLRHAGRTYQ